MSANNNAVDWPVVCREVDKLLKIGLSNRVIAQRIRRSRKTVERARKMLGAPNYDPRNDPRRTGRRPGVVAEGVTSHAYVVAQLQDANDRHLALLRASGHRY